MSGTRAGTHTLMALLLSLALSLAACVRITVEPEAAARGTPVETPASQQEGPDLAVIAIDFDPPLRPDGLVAAGQTTLLGVVENRGRVAAEQVQVEARLLGGESSELLLAIATTVDRIVPGETRLVRFSGVPSLPLRSAYLLRINIPTVPDELSISNNQRTFSLRVDPAAP